MTRSEKKRAKSQRIAIAKGLERSWKKLNATAKVWANLLTKSENPNAGIENRLGYCPSCEEYYCFNYAGGISWCFECHYRSGCLKLSEPCEPLITRECKPCRWKGEDNAKADQVQSLREENRMHHCWECDPPLLSLRRV